MARKAWRLMSRYVAATSATAASSRSTPFTTWSKALPSSSVTATIQDSFFKDSELYSADFAACVMLKCTFEGYEHATVSLSRTDWTGASLFDVDFKRANMYGAVLRNAVLVRCDLRGVNLCSADLSGARFVGCDTTGVDLDGASW